MDFGWDDEQQAFRAKVRGFIEEHWTGSLRGRSDLEAHERAQAYQQLLARDGWLTMSWPTEYGGGGATYFEQMIFAEESTFAAAPNTSPRSPTPR
jgi:alkylation response protein AidB-like acyl-CoA dehydrogenase